MHRQQSKVRKVCFAFWIDWYSWEYFHIMKMCPIWQIFGLHVREMLWNILRSILLFLWKWSCRTFQLLRYISKRFAHTASVCMDWDENPFVHLETLLKMLFCAYAQTTGKGRKGPPRMVGLIDFLEMISILWRCDPPWHISGLRRVKYYVTRIHFIRMCGKQPPHSR